MSIASVKPRSGSKSLERRNHGNTGTFGRDKNNSTSITHTDIIN
jgi:hypothetical protein